MTFVISGSFQEIERKLLSEKIKQHGGRVQSNISKNVDYLVAGEKAGPSKLSNAQTLGVRTLSEAEIIDLIAQASRG